MKTRSQYLSRALLTAGALTLMATSGAFASTPPCTTITNTARLTYSVGGTAQPFIDSASNASNTFNVGVKVLLTVTTTDGGNVTVIPGATPAVLTFTVQNNGNAVHDYALAFAAAANGTASPFGGGNDSFDGTTIQVFVESGATIGYQPLQDTATTIDNLAGDGATRTVYVVYTPNDLTAANGSISVYYLKATTQWADGSAISETPTGSPIAPTAAQQSTCDGVKLIDIVFGDTAGPFPGAPPVNDVARDGEHSDDSAFIVSSANIGVTKGFTVISDPVNLAVNPKAIPGAVVRYSIAIANTGTAAATLSTISDLLANTLQIIPAGATWAVTPVVGTSRTVNSGTLTADTADGNGDGLGHSNTAAVGGTVTATMATILVADVPQSYAAGELKAGETLTLTFDATVQ
jgi:uncharacterized repeat protein (TIGR01451 family)